MIKLREIRCPWTGKRPDFRDRRPSIPEKYFILKTYKEGSRSMRATDAHFGLKTGSVQQWNADFERQGFLSERGRPTLALSEDIADIGKMVNAMQTPCKKADFINMLQEKVDKHHHLRHPDSSGESKPISVRSVHRIISTLDIPLARAEITTDARAVAEESIHNMVSFAAANLAMIPQVPTQLILNMDACHFAVGDNNDTKVEVLLGAEAKRIVESTSNSVKVTEKDKKGITQYFIKYILFMSAGFFFFKKSFCYFTK
jgi:hypothetical protein